MTDETNLTPGAIQHNLGTRRIGQRVVYRPEAPSTNDLARELAEAGEPEGTVVVVDYQNAGRGRLGRRWIAPPCSTLPVSILLRPTAEQLSFLPMAAGVAVSRAVHDETGLQTRLKWPNDVLLDDRKLCGILLEASLIGESVRFAVLGIGLNINLDVKQYAEIAETATSIQQGLGRPVSRLPLLRSLLRHLDTAYEAIVSGRAEGIWNEWRRQLATLGHAVQVTVGTTIEVGVAEDVDQHGQLLLRRADGSAVWIASGEASLRR